MTSYVKTRCIVLQILVPLHVENVRLFHDTLLSGNVSQGLSEFVCRRSAKQQFFHEKMSLYRRWECCKSLLSLASALHTMTFLQGQSVEIVCSVLKNLKVENNKTNQRKKKEQFNLPHSKCDSSRNAAMTITV